MKRVANSNGTRENPIEIKDLDVLTSRSKLDFEDMTGNWYIIPTGEKYKFRYLSYDTTYYIQSEDGKSVWVENQD